MATLTNTKIKDTYDGLLKTADNDVIGASEKNITDGLGNATVLSIGTDSASFSDNVSITGSLTASNTVTAGTVSVGDAIVHTGDTDTKIEFLSNQIKTTLGGTLEISSTIAGTIFYKDIEVNGLTIGKGNGSITQNTAIGVQALDNATGIGNTAVGYASLLDNTTGVSNTALGVNSLRYNTTGFQNTALGYFSLHSNTTGQNNTAVGVSSLYANTGSYNTALGALALIDNTTGSKNIAIGYASLGNNIDGDSSVAVGYLALNANTTGQKNVAIGAEALGIQTTGSFSTAVGYEALMNQTTGSNNTALGYASLRTNTTGTYNIAIGIVALYDNTTGSNNVAIGNRSLENSISGDSNIGIGVLSGNTLTTGSDNIYIGNNADASAVDVINEIVIGASATGNGSNTATYGNSSITKHIFTGGSLGIGSDSPTENLQIESIGSSFIYMSSGSASPATLGMKMGQSISSGSAEAEVSYDVADDLFQIKTGTAASTRRLTIEKNSGKVDITNDFAVDTDTLYVDAANNRVGVGTSSPAVPLHAQRSDDGGISLFRGTSNAQLELKVSSGDFIYNSGNGNATHIFQSNGSEKMRIDSSGNVGIGTGSFSLTHDLTIGNTAASDFVIALRGGVGGFFGWDDSANVTTIQSPNTRALSFKVSSDTFGDAGAEAMRIDSSGNVGIGTSSPSSLMTLNAAAGSALQWQYNSQNYLRIEVDADGGSYYAAANKYHRFFTTGIERLRIDSSGRVGINDSVSGSVATNYNPKLLVGGTIVARSLTANEALIELGGDATSAFITSGKQDGSQTARALRFEVGTSEAMRIDSSGNVGIGNVNPAAYGKFVVNGTGEILNVVSTSGKSRLGLWEGAVGRMFIDTLNGSNGIAFIDGNGSTERMRITSGGNVLINKQTARGSEYLGIESSGAEFCNFQNTSGARAFRVNNINTEGFNASATAIFVGQDGTTSRSINAGGTINASGADYAEYMTKSIQDDISKGDVVGVDSNGQLTNIFNDAISFVVKSTNPSYVGGDTWGVDLEGDDLEIARLKVDRIAFSGQVPCNVYGANVGDYIIPVNDDGKISAQSVSNPSFDEYKLSVGKVWKIMEDGRAWIAVKIG